MDRKGFLASLAASVVGIAAVPAMPVLAQVSAPATGDVAQIYQLQAAFHQAKTAQDIELMMSLWDPGGTLKVHGDPKSPYVGAEQMRAFWLGSGSFKNRRFSLVPSYKTRIAIRSHEADLYFECHDVSDYDSPARNIINDTYLTGTLRNIGGKWVFHDMSAGPSSPLSLTRYYP